MRCQRRRRLAGGVGVENLPLGKLSAGITTMQFLGLILFLSLVCVETPAASRKNGFEISDALIPTDQIKSGGPGKDGIPAIDEPRFVTAEEDRFLRSTDRVIGVTVNGISKAYPIKILNWHEVVNDQFADQAVVITYCPLCATGMVFSAQGADIAITFGVSGLLYNSDVLLYDRPTHSLWSQILGKAVSGPLKGTIMKQLPASHTTWREWQHRHPGTLVLSRKTGFRRDYRTSPYLDYAGSNRLMFPVEHRNNTYRNKEMILGLTLNGQHIAFPFKELKRQGIARFEYQVADQLLTIEWLAKEKTARVLDAQGEELPSVLAYWFAWYAFFPGTLVFEAPDG